MARIYSQRLILADMGPSTPASWLNATADVAIIRDILTYTGGGSNDLILKLNGLVIMAQAIGGSGPTTYHLELRQVIEPGEELQVFVDNEESTVAITGYVFA